MMSLDCCMQAPSVYTEHFRKALCLWPFFRSLGYVLYVKQKHAHSAVMGKDEGHIISLGRLKIKFMNPAKQLCSCVSICPCLVFSEIVLC